MGMMKRKVFYRDEPDGVTWEVNSLTPASAILEVGNSEGLDFDRLDAIEINAE